MDINRRILELMNKRNWTKYKLSKEAKLSNYTIALIEKRNTTPSVNTLIAVCDALGITMSQFFAEDDTEQVALSAQQKELLEKFYMLPKETQELFLKLIDDYLNK